MPKVYIPCYAIAYIKEKIQISETLPYLWCHTWNDGVDEER
jgi:hypothetical protein